MTQTLTCAEADTICRNTMRHLLTRNDFFSNLKLQNKYVVFIVFQPIQQRVFLCRKTYLKTFTLFHKNYPYASKVLRISTGLR